MIVLALSLAFLSFTSAVILPRQDSVTSLSASQINAFTSYTFFASAAYCNPSTTINWSCGVSCSTNPGFVPVASGGDGSSTQFWYVGFDPTLNTIVVAHQGTDPASLVADLTDAELFLTGLNQTMFPGTSGLRVHTGFATTKARSAPDVLAATLQALWDHRTTSVTTVGHSLGGAIALIDAVYLSLHLPSTTTFKFVGYSLPRVGNQDFAAYLDNNFPDLTHINHKKDMVPILPGTFLGYRHPHDEIHIDDYGAWNACAGDDNTSNLCSTRDVSYIFQGNTQDHDGPFNGIVIGQDCYHNIMPFSHSLL